MITNLKVLIFIALIACMVMGTYKILKDSRNLEDEASSRSLIWMLIYLTIIFIGFSIALYFIS